MITITKEEYNKLVKASMLLAALESVGVDNWQGWQDALDYFHKILDEEGIE